MKSNGNLSTKVIVLTTVSKSQNTGKLGNQGNHGNNTINGNLSTKNLTFMGPCILRIF